MAPLKQCHSSLTIVISALAIVGARAEVITYDFPPEFPASEVYRVRVDDQAVQVYHSEKGSFLSFGMTSLVEVTVVYPKAPKEVVIRPLSAGVEPTMVGNTCTFTLPRPMNLTVEADSDLSHPLFVFAKPQ